MLVRPPHVEVTAKNSMNIFDPEFLNDDNTYISSKLQNHWHMFLTLLLPGFHSLWRKSKSH